MKKLTLIVTVLTLAFLVSSAQANAAWWNPLSWFSGVNQVKEREQQVDTPATSDSQIRDADSKTQDQSAPNVQSGTNEIEELKEEISTLKASLDNLYKSHNELVAKYNELLQYTNYIAASSKSVGVTSISSDLDTRVTDVEKKLNNVCAQIFSSIGGLSTNKCPSSQFIIRETLESRIKKLEGGY